MRIHTRLTAPALYAVLAIEKAAGRIFDAVYLDTVEHGSRSHPAAFEVRLVALEYDGVGRRRPAGYSRNWNDDEWAATYDEWGWFLSRLFEVDPTARCGSAEHPDYADLADFDRKTGYTYAPYSMLTVVTRDGEHNLDVLDLAPYVYRTAIRKDGKPKAGRAGYGRPSGKLVGVDYLDRGLASGWLKHAPRTVDDVLGLARLERQDVLAAFTGCDSIFDGGYRRLPANALADAYALGQVVEYAGAHVRTTDDRVLDERGERPVRIVTVLDRQGRPTSARYDDEGRLTDLGGTPLDALYARNAASPATYDEAVAQRAHFNAETRRWEVAQ